MEDEESEAMAGRCHPAVAWNRTSYRGSRARIHLPAGRGHSDCSVSSFSLGHFYGRLIYRALDRYSGRAPGRVAIGFECTCRSPGPRIYPIPYCASSWQSCINNWTHDDDDDELNDANAIPAPGCYLLVAVPSRVRAYRTWAK